MTSTYLLIKNILDIDEVILRDFNQIKFKQDTLEQQYLISKNKKSQRMIMIPSLVIFLIHVFYTFNNFIILGLDSFFEYSVIFCSLDLSILLLFLYFKFIKSKGKKLSDYGDKFLIIRSAFLITEYLFNFTFFFFSNNKNIKYLYSRIFYNLAIVKNMIYLFLLPNNTIIALILHFLYFLINVFILIFSRVYNSNFDPTKNEIVSEMDKEILLRNSSYSNSNNNSYFEENLFYLRYSINVIDILFESAIFVGTLFLKRYVNILARQSFLEKYKFKHFFKYCDDLICGLNGYHISFLNSRIAYASNNLTNFLKKNFSSETNINHIEMMNQKRPDNNKYTLGNNYEENYENNYLECNRNDKKNYANYFTEQTIQNKDIPIKLEKSGFLANRKYSLGSSHLYLGNKKEFDIEEKNLQRILSEFLKNLKYIKDEKFNLYEIIKILNKKNENIKKIYSIPIYEEENENIIRKSKTIYKISQFKNKIEAPKRTLTDNNFKGLKKVKKSGKFLSILGTSRHPRRYFNQLMSGKKISDKQYHDMLNETDKNLISNPKIQVSDQSAIVLNKEVNLIKKITYKNSFNNELNLRETANFPQSKKILDKQNLSFLKIVNDLGNKNYREDKIIEEEAVGENEKNHNSSVNSKENPKYNCNKNKFESIDLNEKDAKLYKNKPIERTNLVSSMNMKLGENFLNNENINSNYVNEISKILDVKSASSDNSSSESDFIYIIQKNDSALNYNLSKNKKSFDNKRRDSNFESLYNGIKSPTSNLTKKKSNILFNFDRGNNESRSKIHNKRRKNFTNTEFNSCTSNNSRSEIESISKSHKRTYKKFKKLGEFFIELKEKKKFFTIYYRKLNNVLDIYLYDFTKIKNSENISSENKIKHKILSKIAHEFKTPLNSILGLINNLKSLNKNYLITRDLNIIQALSNYTIYLISDVIHYASNDNNSPYNIVKNLINCRNTSRFSFMNNNSKSLNNFDCFNKNKIFSNSNIENDVDIKKKLNIFIRIIDVKNCLFFCFDILNALLSCHENKKDLISTELFIEDKINLFSVKTDEIRLNQIIVNFISNSVKFTKKGKIALIASFLNKKIKNKADGCKKFYLKVSIVDTGIGISEEQQKKLFTEDIKLNTKHDFNQQGSGLGLSICASMIKLLNLKIYFASKENLGSVFSIFIPVKEITPENNNSLKSKKNKNLNFLNVKKDEKNISLKQNIDNNTSINYDKSIIYDIPLIKNENNSDALNSNKDIKIINKKYYDFQDQEELYQKYSKSLRLKNSSLSAINNQNISYNEFSIKTSGISSKNILNKPKTSNYWDNDLEKKTQNYFKIKNLENKNVIYDKNKSTFENINYLTNSNNYTVRTERSDLSTKKFPKNYILSLNNYKSNYNSIKLGRIKNKIELNNVYNSFQDRKKKNNDDPYPNDNVSNINYNYLSVNSIKQVPAYFNNDNQSLNLNIKTLPNKKDFIFNIHPKNCNEEPEVPNGLKKSLSQMKLKYCLSSNKDLKTSKTLESIFFKLL